MRAAARIVAGARVSVRVRPRRCEPTWQHVAPSLGHECIHSGKAVRAEVEPAAQEKTRVGSAPWAGSSRDSPSLRFQSSSSSSARLATNSVEQQLPANLHMRNLLRDTAQLFAPASPLASPEWRKRLDLAAQSLNGAAEHLATTRPLRVGVVGNVDAGTPQFLRALLEDPLVESDGSNATAKEAMQQIQDHLRRDAGEDVLITHGDAPIASSSRATIVHPGLRRHNIEFLQFSREVAATTDSALVDELYACDMVIFITDDATLAAHARYGRRLETNSTLQLMRLFAAKPCTRVIVNHSGSQLTDTATLLGGLEQAIGRDARLLLERGCVPEQEAIFHTSFSLAIRANDTLRRALREAGPTTPPASVWDRFATLYESSGLRNIKKLLLPTHEAAQLPNARQAALQSSVFVLRRALDQALALILRDVDFARQAQGAADVLSSDVEIERARLHAKVFETGSEYAASDTKVPTARHQRAADRSKSVDAASRDAWGLVEKTFSTRLPWWKILWKVDDVRAETEASVEHAFGKNLEQRLMLETGKLLGVAMRLHRRTRSLFRDLDKEWDHAAAQIESHHADSRNPFSSPILLNELRKYPLEGIDTKLRADLLTRPIVERRHQLLSRGGPVDVLCQRAQGSVVTSVGITSTAGLLSVVGGAAGSSIGAGTGLPAALSAIALDPATAGASFAFASVFSAWLLQTRWTRAKRRFWRDWERIADGLDDDLKHNLDNVFATVVAAQSLKAIEGLRALVTGYLIELEDAQRILGSVLEHLRESAATSRDDKG